MNISPLFSSILRGQWAIDPRMIETNQLLLEKLLNRDFSADQVKLLSEVKPFMWSSPEEDPATGSSQGNSQGLDSLPEESTILLSVSGTMLKYGTLCTYGTQEISRSLLEFGMHTKVGSIVLEFDSGGGTPDAIAPLAQAIQQLRTMGKPVVACVDLCASAAYFAASYCNEIVACNDISSEIGSIGVMCSIKDYAKKFENEGIVNHVIYSNLSDYKNRPFEKALKGEFDEIKLEELDPLARRFQAAIRANRGNKLVEDTPGLLAGKMFYAEKAKEVGLIDHVGTLDLAIARTRQLRETNIVNQYFNL